jgi:hypothetical protein
MAGVPVVRGDGASRFSRQSDVRTRVHVAGVQP